MLKNRRMLLLGVLLLATACLVLGVLPPRPGVTKANFDRIQKKMTLKEVEAIFGAKGKLWAKRPVLDMTAFPWVEPGQHFWEATDGAGSSCVFSGERCDCAEWRADDGSMATITLHDNRVLFLNWHESSTETIIDKFCRWLHLR